MRFGDQKHFMGFSITKAIDGSFEIRRDGELNGEVWKVDTLREVHETIKKLTYKAPAPKTIKETKCTCQSCGNVWHYGKKETWDNAGNAIHNFGEDVSWCRCCGPSRNKKVVVDFDKCPKCGSRAVKKETMSHAL